jgi:hypothetical protein
MKPMIRRLAAALVVVTPLFAQSPLPGPPLTSPHGSRDPFPNPIPAEEGAIKVNFVEFATLPDVKGLTARPMLMTYEPRTQRLFVNDMHGALYLVSADGKKVTPYLDLAAPQWELQVQSENFERGFQSFAFHPEFNERGARGYGKVYVYVDTSNQAPTPDFAPPGGRKSHHAVLLEWTAKSPSADSYDGGAPRELMRWERPFVNHNGGQLGFNPLARRGSADYGLLYVGNADGGSGGDPMNLSQNLGSTFGKILRIDPLGTDSTNGKYGIPKDNPFAGDNDPATLGEIYAYGARNPQRFAWDSKTGTLYMADIGQGIIEEVGPVPKGANLGWRVWEGSFLYVAGQEVSLDKPRSDPKVTYPVVEYSQIDPIFLYPSSAITMGYVYRNNRIKQLNNLLLFGDNPSGEILYIHADKLPPAGGQDAIRRVVFNDKGQTRTLLQLVREKNMAQGRKPANRADLRFGEGPNGRLFILNKYDGVIREIVP